MFHLESRYKPLQLTSKTRIRNQSLLQLLSVAVRLGSQSISWRVFVEASRTRGFNIGESYFLHFDTLIDYGFLVVTESPAKALKFKDQISANVESSCESWDMQFSITHSGLEFFHRYG